MCEGEKLYILIYDFLNFICVYHGVYAIVGIAAAHTQVADI